MRPVCRRKPWRPGNAHRVHYLIALVLTGEAGDDRHGELTQFIIDLARPGSPWRSSLEQWRPVRQVGPR